MEGIELKGMMLPSYYTFVSVTNVAIILYIYIIYNIFHFHSLRAQYGTDIKQNAIHASDSTETSARELAFFFPNYNIPWVPGTEPPIQRTLALIRPSAFQDHKGVYVHVYTLMCMYMYIAGTCTSMYMYIVHVHVHVHACMKVYCVTCTCIRNYHSHNNFEVIMNVNRL